MADDIADLKARVDAAREQLAGDSALVQKVELRLNDLAHIVEGSLARQNVELDAARERLASLEVDLGRALARAEQAGGEAARAERLSKDNGELRQMVMTLLEIIEGRQKSPLAAVMQQLEENVSALLVAPAAEPLPEEPLPEEPESEPEPEPPAPLPESPEAMPAVVAQPSSAADSTEATPSTPETATPAEADPAAQEVGAAADEAIEAEPVAPSPEIDDLSEIALYDAADEVVEPAKG